MHTVYGCFNLWTQHVLTVTRTIVYLPNFLTLTHFLQRPPTAASKLPPGVQRGRLSSHTYGNTRRTLSSGPLRRRRPCV